MFLCAVSTACTNVYKPASMFLQLHRQIFRTQLLFLLAQVKNLGITSFWAKISVVSSLDSKIASLTSLGQSLSLFPAFSSYILPPTPIKREGSDSIIYTGRPNKPKPFDTPIHTNRSPINQTDVAIVSFLTVK